MTLFRAWVKTIRRPMMIVIAHTAFIAGRVDLRVHEFEDVHDSDADIGAQVVIVAEEEDLLVENGLVPRLLLAETSSYAIHQPDRTRVGLEVEQTTVQIQVPCCLK